MYLLIVDFLDKREIESILKPLVTKARLGLEKFSVESDVQFEPTKATSEVGTKL